MSGAIDELYSLWSAGTPLVAMTTIEESRALALIETLADRISARFAVWSCHRGVDPIAPEARDLAKALDAFEHQRGPVLAVMLDPGPWLSEPRVARRIRDLIPALSAQRTTLVLLSPRLELPETLAADVVRFALPLPDAEERAAALNEALRDAGVASLDDLARHRALVAAAGLSIVQARRAFGRALRDDPLLTAQGLAVLAREKKSILALDVGLEHVDTAEHPDDIGGLDTFKAWLAERAQAFLPEARGFGLAAPRGVLLLGVQGCGKSLSAKCVAAQLAIPLLRLDLPRVLGSSGADPSAEESLRRALAAAEAMAPVALWIDEIEKGFAGASAARAVDSRAARLLGAFSTWLQERNEGVFVVATANDVSALPPELLRRGRFDELFFVDLPDLDARRAILQIHLRRRQRDPTRFDLQALAEQCADYSGAELEQVVVGGLHHAFASGREVEMRDLRRAARDLVPLYRTYEESIKELRGWADGRARPAGREGAIVDWFRRA